MYAPTAAAATAARPLRARAKINAISPAVATISPTRWPGGDAVLGGDLEDLTVEHDVGQDRADDAAEGLSDRVGGEVAAR